MNANETAARSDSDQQNLAVTPKQFVDYLNAVNRDAKCTYCGTGEYGVGADPTGKSASIVATPVPHVQGVGLWFFPATCMSCGYTILFHAPTVTAAIKNKD